MREETRTLHIGGAQCTVTVLIIEESDRPQLSDLYDSWKQLYFGMKAFRSRGINFPEGISESAFCLEYGSARVLDVQPGSTSFDTIDLSTMSRQQIKATSVKNDLTSFGPTSIWDELFWLDFWRGGSYNGSYDVYKIPNDLIYDFQINRKETFRDQQKQGRRPRFSMRSKIIKENGLKPDRTCHI